MGVEVGAPSGKERASGNQATELAESHEPRCPSVASTRRAGAVWLGGNVLRVLLLQASGVRASVVFQKYSWECR